ncbi:MAG: hypothetical protein Q4F23_02775 [Coriobacteriia bacterium]|nr:hypothetical protein [Coriobacteriia bacterium]
MGSRSKKSKQQQLKLKAWKQTGAAVIFACSALMLVSTALMFMSGLTTYGIAFGVLTAVCIIAGITLRKGA